MQFADVVATSASVTATSKRSLKTEHIAVLLREASPEEVRPVVGYLTGDAHQGRIGIGWASVAGLAVRPATEPSLSVLDVDEAISELQTITGLGSQERRRDRLETLYGRATEAEADFLSRLFVGDIRQGAHRGVMTDAVAKASGVKLATVRRAQMLAGDLGTIAHLALTDGTAAVEKVGLRVLNPIEPMLASTATGVAEAMEEIGEEVSVEWKLDGIRIQVHRLGDVVRIFTRNLNDVTSRLSDVIDQVLQLDVVSVVLDGEVIGASNDEGPDVFQDTMSRFGTEDHAGDRALRPHFFDILHLDGSDLVDEPLVARRDVLRSVVGDLIVTGTITDDPSTGSQVFEAALAEGHEGVMVKRAASTYEAGRRGKSWRKVKPVVTLDLIVIGAEWGHGRRTGLLSNLHLGARDPSGGPAVMVGKTFKGMTDELLKWQTATFLEREVERRGIAVFVEQDLVVEIALDGVQASTRYPGGVALRFARVRGYRSDKSAVEADTIDDVRALLKD